MKKLWALLLIMVIALGTCGAALAEGHSVVVLQHEDGSLNLRAGQGKEYASNGYVHNGDRIEIIKVGSEWTRVRAVSSGKEGYIKNMYIGYKEDDDDEEKPVFERGKNVYVGESGGTLNVRAGAGKSYGINGYVHHGDAITLLKLGDEWSKIRVNKTGVTGYIKNIYIYGYATAGWSMAVEEILGGGSSEDDSSDGGYDAAIVVTRYKDSLVNVRASASSTADIVGTVSGGTHLKVYGSKGNWYKVKAGSYLSGYISKSYVSMGIAARTTANLNVRKGAGSGKALITTLDKGTRVTVLSVDGNWGKIKYGRSSIGYVCLDYLNY